MLSPSKFEGDAEKVQGEVGHQGEGGQNLFPLQNLSQQNSPKNLRVSPVRSKGPSKPRGKISMVLLIPLKFSNGQCRECQFLVDTGSEMNLIRRDVVPENCWENVAKKINFYTASGMPLKGGGRLCSGQFIFRSFEVGEEDKKIGFQNLDASFYEAEISVDGIISFEWLQKIT